jgi:hypothetical protein
MVSTGVPGMDATIIWDLEDDADRNVQHLR